MKLVVNPKLGFASRKFLDELVSKIVVHDVEVTLRSGEVSNFYIDFKKTFAKDPELLSFLTQALWFTLDPQDRFIYIAGMGYSGVILTTLMTFVARRAKPILIRPEVRSHGIVKPVIWDERGIGPVYIVDDVLSTGETVRGIMRQLAEYDLPVKGIGVLVNRGKIKSVDGVPVTWLFEVEA